MQKRLMSVAGSFYPNDASLLLQYFESFTQSSSNIKTNLTNIKGMIVPHAGYVYSGFTANKAYTLASQNQPKTVIIIGPSHRVHFQNSSIYKGDFFQTPLGEIQNDMRTCQILYEEFEFLNFHESVHAEHSTETQFPFVKHYFPKAKMIEIVYSEESSQNISDLIQLCLNMKDILLIISTDLSHFYSQKRANSIDATCIDAILNKKPTRLHQGCEACGILGVEAMVSCAVKSNLTVELLHYCTSYEYSKDDKSVVGYASFLMGE